MGKTTTIGKLAARLRKEGNQTVLLGACDTLRAAAVEQLGEWAVRANVDIVTPIAGETDPVPVVTRSIQRARKGEYDVLIIDTSGRLSNNFELVDQLQQVARPRLTAYAVLVGYLLSSVFSHPLLLPLVFYSHNR